MKACGVKSKAARIAQEHDVGALGTAADVAREILDGARQGVVDSALDVGEVAGGTHVGGYVDGAPVAANEFQHAGRSYPLYPEDQVFGNDLKVLLYALRVGLPDVDKILWLELLQSWRVGSAAR